MVKMAKMTRVITATAKMAVMRTIVVAVKMAKPIIMTAREVVATAKMATAMIGNSCLSTVAHVLFVLFEPKSFEKRKKHMHTRQAATDI